MLLAKVVFKRSERGVKSGSGLGPYSQIVNDEVTMRAIWGMFAECMLQVPSYFSNFQHLLAYHNDGDPESNIEKFALKTGHERPQTLLHY